MSETTSAINTGLNVIRTGIGIFGGDTGGFCGQQQARKANEIRQALDQSQITALVKKHRQMFSGSNIQANASSIAHHYYGGGDCVVTSQNGQRFQIIVDDAIRTGKTPTTAGSQNGSGTVIPGSASKSSFLGGNNLVWIVLLALVGAGIFFGQNQ